MTTARLSPMSPKALPARPRIPLALWIGVVYLLACEALLMTDVRLGERGALHSSQMIEAFEASHPPRAAIARAARFVAINMTPLVWPGYVLLLDGILVLQSGSSPPRLRPNHFALLCLASIVIWCVFDWVNFYYIGAWRYIGVPIESVLHRYWGYTFAFATIVPGMLMSGQMFAQTGIFDRARSPGWRMPKWAAWLVLVLGAAMFILPLIQRNPKGNLTLWVSLVFLLDPINLKLGRPSVLRDWQNGWYGRTLAAFAGGLLCGLLWEFFNYWALVKWVYILPFLGPAEHVRLFEMPLLGFLGFIPFGLECWVMWQTIRIPLTGLAEPLPDARSLL